MSANDTNKRRAVPAPARRPASRSQRQVSEVAYSNMQNDDEQDNERAQQNTSETQASTSKNSPRQPIKKAPIRTSGAKSFDQQAGTSSTTGQQQQQQVNRSANRSKQTPNFETKSSTNAAQVIAPIQSGGGSRQQTRVNQDEMSRSNQLTTGGGGGGSGTGTPRSESTQHLTADMDDGSSCIVDDVNDEEMISPIDDEDHLGGSGGTRMSLGLAAGLTKNLIWAVFASTVGSSFQHGYNGGVVNAPERLIGQFVNATFVQRYGMPATDGQIDLIIAIIVSIFCIGGCVGALMTAFVADRLGRKEGLMYNNIIVLIASPIMASAKSMSSYELLIFGRFLIGINAGLNAGLAPLYLNEIAPIRLRGALGTIYQLVITISILLSNIFGLPSLLGDAHSWPILFAIPIIPAAFMLAALPHCCESPKHLLLNQGRELQAQQALAWLRQTGDVQEEMDDLRSERELNIINNRTISLGDMWTDQSLRKPMTIAIVIMLSQQLSGINAVLFFSTSIFRDAGLGEQAAVKATLGMGIVNVAMTLVSLFLVDRAGRRTLHMTGLMGMAATSLVLAVCLQSVPTATNGMDNATPALTSGIAVVAIYVFIAMFASGPGAIPWFLVAELFPSNARPLASSIAVAVNWLANFTVSLCFLPLSNILHGFVFVLFAILLVIFYLFTYYKVPETKGATSEEISALFKR